MQMYSSGAPGFTLSLANEEATRRFAADIANILEPGDFIALGGDLGTGKTTFVRAMIAYLANDAAIAGAKRVSNGKFARPARGTSEQKIGDVDTRNQQDKSDSSKEHQ